MIVSPFISEHEKKIRRKIEETGANIILIVHEEFDERYKPSLHEFNLCCEGRLLIISLGKPKSTELTYEICTEMNELAAKIAG